MNTDFPDHTGFCVSHDQLTTAPHSNHERNLILIFVAFVRFVVEKKYRANGWGGKICVQP